MISRRIIINLVVFALASAALVAYGFVDLLGNPLAATTTVYTVMPTASGLSDNFTVTYEGVDVGSVKNVSLVKGGAKITMVLNPGTKVPNDVAASITIANALGQQELDLVASHAGTGDPPLENGAVVPAVPGGQPADVGTVVAEATALIRSIPPADLNSLLHQLALALQGNGQNLRTIASASELFSQEFLSYQNQFRQLLANAPPVLDVITANAAQLQQGLADTATLAAVLASHSPQLVQLFNQGAAAADNLNALVTQNEPNLGCFVHDLAAVNANLAQPTNLANLSTTLSTNQEFFGAVAALAPVGPAKALTAGDSAHNQEWLRTRLLLPPRLPMGDSYLQAHGVPPVLPGAACQTEFGSGVGPGVQPHFTPAGPDARVVAPTAAEAHVRGGGATPDAAPSAARLPQGGSGGDLPVMTLAGALIVMGWFFTLGRRRTVRSARPVRASHLLRTRRGT